MVLKSMDNIKNDRYFAEKALAEIEIIVEYTKGLSYEEFMSDGKNIDATMFRLQQMVEQIKSLSDEFKTNYASVPWGEIIGFRNGIVHEYGATNYGTVYEIISHDIYQLKALFEEYLQ